MAKFGAVFNSDIKKTDSRPRSETKWIHYTKLIDNTDQYRKSATEDDIAAFAELIKSAGRVLQDLLVRKSGTDTYEIIAGHHRRLACRYLVEQEAGKRAGADRPLPEHPACRHHPAQQREEAG